MARLRYINMQAFYLLNENTSIVRQCAKPSSAVAIEYLQAGRKKTKAFVMNGNM